MNNTVKWLNAFLIVGIIGFGAYFIYINGVDINFSVHPTPHMTEKLLAPSDKKEDVVSNTTENKENISLLPTDIRFAICGDSESSIPYLEKCVDAIKKESYRFSVNIGDLFETNTRDEQKEKEIAKKISEVQPLPYFVVGNHDIDLKTRLPIHISYFPNVFEGNKKSYYSFNYDGVHFVVLNNADRKIGFSNEQLTWLSEDLAGSQELLNSIAKEKMMSAPPLSVIYFMHRPIAFPLSELYNDDETKQSRESNTKLLDIISKYDTKRIFAGHIHGYFEYPISHNEKEIPVTVVGGAPGSQSIGTTTSSHYIDVHVTNDSIEIKKNKLE